MISWPFWLLAIVGLLALANLAVHLVYAFAALRRFENRPAFLVPPPPNDALPPEPFQTATADGLILRGGVYYPPDGHPRGVVVFCPETEGSFLTAMNYAPALVEAGFAVVSFSFRNHAPSDTAPGYHATHWFTSYEVTDIHAILDFVQDQPQFTGLPVGLLGVSRGASAALVAGATRPEVEAIWAQGAFSTHRLVVYHSLKWTQTVVGKWGQFVPAWHVAVTIWFMLKISQWHNGCRFVRIEPWLPRWKHREVMFISGARDTYVPSHLTEQLCLQTGHDPRADYWVVPHAKHNLERNAAPREFDHRLVEFFERISGPREQVFPYPHVATR